jgi:hypothetical protein
MTLRIGTIWAPDGKASLTHATGSGSRSCDVIPRHHLFGDHQVVGVQEYPCAECQGVEQAAERGVLDGLGGRQNLGLLQMA